MLQQKKIECPVCKTMQDSDLLYHGPGAAALWYSCGHEAHYDKTDDGKKRTRYFKAKELIKEFTE